MQPPASLIARPAAGGLVPPSRRVAAARARYQTDGSTGLSGGKLLVALYQRLLRDIDGAATAIEARDIEGAHLQLVHAQEIVDGLEDALDPSVWDQADRMYSIYGHLRRELVAANIGKDGAIVARCRRIVEPLSDTWQEALDLTAPTVLPTTATAEVAP